MPFAIFGMPGPMKGATAMNAETLTKRLKSATRSTSIHALVWGLVRGERVRPNYLSGSGRYTSNTYREQYLLDVCLRVGIDVAHGNDAPRGGATGAWVELTRKGRKATEKIRAVERVERERAMKAKEEKERADKALRETRMEAMNVAITPGMSAPEVLHTWYAQGHYHPAPMAVLEAKASLGLSWSEVSIMCKSSFVPARQGE